MSESVLVPVDEGSVGGAVVWRRVSPRIIAADTPSGQPAAIISRRSASDFVGIDAHGCALGHFCSVDAAMRAIQTSAPAPS